MTMRRRDVEFEDPAVYWTDDQILWWAFRGRPLRHPVSYVPLAHACCEDTPDLAVIHAQRRGKPIVERRRFRDLFPGPGQC